MTSLRSTSKASSGNESQAPRSDGSVSKCDHPAIKSPVAIIAFVILAAAALTGDLLSKHLVFEWLLQDPTLNANLDEVRATRPGDLRVREALRGFQRPICPKVKFTLSTNPGVVFGLPMPRWIVAVITVFTVALVFLFFATAPVRARIVHLALGLILAGALGNLYDRLFSSVTVAAFEPIRYEVRDFIDCSELYYPWVFNLADAYLVTGVALLALVWLRTARKDRSTHPQAKRKEK